MTRIITITLAGGNRESVIEDALRSALFADHHILVDTGETAQAAIAVARSIPEIGGKLTIAKYPREFDCADARNFGLRAATSIASGNPNAWAMQLDTDERMQVNGHDIHSFLGGLAPEVNTVQVYDVGRHYSKERFFRLPPAAQYTGRVHELYESPEVCRVVLDGVRFEELQKSKEEQDVMQEYVRKECVAWLAEDPGNLRATIYLGNTLSYQHKFEQALPYYLDYAARTPHEQEHGWGMFRAANCYGWRADELQEAGEIAEARELRQKAIDTCVTALKRCPYFTEIYWWLAQQEAKMPHDSPEDATNGAIRALAWANNGIINGDSFSEQFVTPTHVRVGFQMPEARSFACWELRRNLLAAFASNAPMLMPQVEMANKIVRKLTGQDKAEVKK